MNNTNLQDLLRHQHSYINKPITSPFSSIAGTSADPTPFTPPPTPTTTIAFNVLKPKRKKPDPITIPTTSTVIIPPCTECGKRFSSWKALFGHMRCHPERQWRGINPPPNFRRGAQFTGEEYEVASSLVLLANGPARDKGGSRKKRRSEEAELTAVGCDHKCGVCLRGFSSGQALGGHMRCHWDKVEDCSLTAVVAASGSNSRDFVLDLNLPPPEGCVAAAAEANVLDLRLGFPE